MTTTFPDIETELVSLLTPVGVHVGTQVPADRPASFVRVWVTGGAAAQRVLDRPTITCTSTAPTGPTASALANDCRDVFLIRFGAANELTRPYFDPDPDTGDSRYTFSFRVRGRALDN